LKQFENKSWRFGKKSGPFVRANLNGKVEKLYRVDQKVRQILEEMQ